MEKHVTELIVGKWYEATTEFCDYFDLWNSENPSEAEIEKEICEIKTPFTFLVLKNVIEIEYEEYSFFSFKILVNGLVKNLFLRNPLDEKTIQITSIFFNIYILTCEF
jgi:hypothetical protein